MYSLNITEMCCRFVEKNEKKKMQFSLINLKNGTVLTEYSTIFVQLLVRMSFENERVI